MNYPELAFTSTIKDLQEQYGSRSGYERMERYVSTEGLTLREIQLIAERDSFYVASFGENDYPYIQHRGGPKGFLKVIDGQTLGFLDFSGNKQYITVGNVKTNNKVSLILVDYPRRSRLKIYAEAEIKTMEEDPDLVKKLELSNYKYKPERIILYHIEAFDWNCPQHITPRYAEEDIQNVIDSERNYIVELEKENKELKEQLSVLEEILN